MEILKKIDKGVWPPIFAAVCYFGALLVFSASTIAFDFPAERQRILSLEQQIRENSGQADESQRLQSFIDLYFKYTLLEYPEFATMIGHKEGNDRWTDQSLKAVARRRVDEIRFRDLVRSINRGNLKVVEQLNYDLLLRKLEDSVQGQAFRGEYLAVTQLDGIHHSVPEIISMMPKSSVKHYEDILVRLSNTSDLVDDSITLLKKGIEHGIIVPRVVMRDVPRQITDLLDDKPLQSSLLEPFKTFPEGITKRDQWQLKHKAVRIFNDQIKPALQKLHNFLKNEYIPATRQSIGLNHLPNGSAWYSHQVRVLTTTDMTPSAIHQVGLEEVKRIRSEMEKLIIETEFRGSFSEFNRNLSTNPRFYFVSANDLLSAYRSITKRANSQLGKLFKHLPKQGFEVVAVPAYVEKSKPAAYYQPGSLDAGRPGYFFVNTYELKSRPKWEMEALALHEAVPGHHLQISLQQELDDLPWFRRHGGYTAYMEGWGLYAESLGYEIGFYQDIYSRYGQLSFEMWRAVRLVVDTGIHSLGWSRRQAINYFKENTGKSAHEIKVEVDRYIVWPAQALAYKIGELKIKQLRERASETLGEQFDMRVFHDKVLGDGAVPLDILQARFDEWLKPKY